MREGLKRLYIKNKKAFEVWNYLWLFSEQKKIQFELSDLSKKLDIPYSTLNRILNNYDKYWNKKKTYVEYYKVGYKKYEVAFHINGKKKTSNDSDTIYEELFGWLKDYYLEHDFDYVNLKDHKRYIKTICNKLKKAMKERGTEVTEELTKQTFKFIFTNIDEWWVNTGNITLTVISKNFDKILNQVKSKNGNKKRDSYSRAAAEVDEVDFSQFTNH